ncbi:MAG TPA: glycoside hydrolase family 20 zincin-like fold domain-containing protein [Kiritimatiellia bacterium]|jgi:hypothetical protein|nr:glycoside hydrolase family 20 zincin-like fold domain-containing protein [Kiritimatiellia bacterium]HOM59055.1 glycoside hydrolase family 20 zincin-like fold domain-containing protein [Kiritimatiellia bacterium]HOR96974.1 glycoside hydrolase family 20 zincin-like fold domain-containing protein [Kiritimatiellia bacterium]HPK36658.1 glycoside hydrolase family 20 zincin-like fold domain-containing protein [Kiritimatiellia bacterium]HPW74527.1 glycoside hydrolase family 20 zincin-like fold domai
MEKGEAQIIKSRMIPYPKQVTITAGPVVKVDRELAVTVTLKDEDCGLKKRVSRLFKSYFGVSPKLTFKTDASLVIPQDGYRFKIASGSGLAIEATGEGGVLNALKTLRQLAEPERGVEKMRCYFLPEMAVEDAAQWPTMQYFHEKGFPVLACPWKNTEGVRSQARLVNEKGMTGMLCTTWNYMHSLDMYRMLYAGAHATWGYDGTGWNASSAFNRHVRQIGWDIPVKRYRDTGVAQWQVPPENALLH